MNKITEKTLRKLIREQIEKEMSNSSTPNTIHFSLPITLSTYFSAEDFEDSETTWEQFIEGIKNKDEETLKWVFDALQDDDVDLMNYGIEDINIKFDDETLEEGDYEISNKLPPSEIEKKKKEIKRKDPKATIAVKDPMLKEEDEEDLDDDAVDKQAQKGAKTVNRKASKLDRVTRDLVQLQGIMKEMAKKYQTAEGEEKERIVADLKKKTKAKKELEALKSQLESGVVGKGGEVGLEIDEA